MKSARDFDLTTIVGAGHTPSLTSGQEHELILSWLGGQRSITKSVELQVTKRHLFVDR